MKLTFATLLETMEQSKNDDYNEKSLKVIRNGLAAHPDFWKNFLSIMSDSDGVSILLNIPSEKVSAWHSLIQEGLDKVAQLDDENSKLEKAKPVSTQQFSDSENSKRNEPASTKPLT